MSWLRDKLQVIADAADSEAVGSSVEDTAGAHPASHLQLPLRACCGDPETCTSTCCMHAAPGGA